MRRVSSLIILTSALSLGLLGAVACSDDGLSTSGGPSSSGNPGPGPGTDGGTDPGSERPVEELQGDITSDKTLSTDKQYLLKGLVSVKPGATLTIPKGSLIKGDNSSKAVLLIEAGAKIMAEGTEDEPIVFTSQAIPSARKPGQWGGLIILGKAPINMKDGQGKPIQGKIEGILANQAGSSTGYGGNDPEDSSGVLRYVRIEYAGILIEKDNEVNGITFGGVGRGTKVDHIQVRKALDDCFEFFGGTVDAKYLACQHNEDDGFDFDNGYSGRLQFLILQQDPKHTGEDNGVESDNDSTGSMNEPITAPTIFNFTLCGKNVDAEQQQYGLLLRKNTGGVYRNMLVTGFEAALDLRDNKVTDYASSGKLAITNSLFFNMKGPAADLEDGVVYAETEFLTTAEKENEQADAVKQKKSKPNYIDDAADTSTEDGRKVDFSELKFLKPDTGGTNLFRDPMISGCFNANEPVFGPETAITENAATPPSDGFFDATAKYVGAFKDTSDNWATKGKWAVWSDQ